MEICFHILIFISIISAHVLGEIEDHTSDITFREYVKIKPVLRIIGGEEAPPHAFPYQVAIYITKPDRIDFCGGSLISPNYVLTAAHCVEHATTMDLIFGAQDVTKNESTQIRQTSSSFVYHKQWNNPAYANDIALIKLSVPINETEVIKMIKIASEITDHSGETGVIAGWGTTNNDQNTVTPKLRYVKSTIMSNKECQSYDSEYKSILQPSMMCFSGSGVVGSCGGDSGGPITVKNEQVGIISFGKKNCTQGNPSVMTRLSNFVGWLKNNSDINL